MTEYDVGEIDVWTIDGEPELDGVYVTLVVGCDIAQENVVLTVLDVEGTVMTPSTQRILLSSEYRIGSVLNQILTVEDLMVEPKTHLHSR